MTTLCIPKKVAARMKIALRKGSINIATLADMKESSKRRAAFREIVGDDVLAKWVNTEFEKALVSNKQDAMLEWAKKTFVGKRKNAYEGVTKKIRELKNVNAFNNAAYEDLVMDKLGANISLEDANKIVKKAEALQKLQSPQLGDPINYKEETIEYFTKKKELEDLMYSIGPHSKMAVLTQTIFRGNMLFSGKSPVLNVISNTTGGIIKLIERRLFAKRPMGLNGDIAWEYVKMVNKIYAKSGYDISSKCSRFSTA